MTTCKPALEDINSMVFELNKSSNFSSFVLKVREGFKQQCVKEVVL